MLKSKIGIIGITGKMGTLVAEEVEKRSDLELGVGFSKTSGTSLKDTFSFNDYVVDFSNPLMLSDVINTALLFPKPIVICTTGWNYDDHRESILKLSLRCPVLIAPNTSLGIIAQKFAIDRVMDVLDSSYDIDLLERHHNRKEDAPSGTAKSILESIVAKKKKNGFEGFEVDNFCNLNSGKRDANKVYVSWERKGGIFGEHEVTFTSENEMISITHRAFNRKIFANGALRIVDWFIDKNPKNGIYHMEDVMGLKI